MESGAKKSNRITCLILLPQLVGAGRHCQAVRGHALKPLVETAWAAVKVKDSFYQEKYYRIKARREAKRAIAAVAHRLRWFKSLT